MTPFELLEAQLDKADGKKTYLAIVKEMDAYLGAVEEDDRLAVALVLIANLTVRETLHRVAFLCEGRRVPAEALVGYTLSVSDSLSNEMIHSLKQFISDCQ